MAKKSGSGESKSAPKRGTHEKDKNYVPSHAKPADMTHKKGELTKDIDELVDEIDDVLEENAEKFVKGYVQRGGQ